MCFPMGGDMQFMMKEPDQRARGWGRALMVVIILMIVSSVLWILTPQFLNGLIGGIAAGIGYMAIKTDAFYNLSLLFSYFFITTLNLAYNAISFVLYAADVSGTEGGQPWQRSLMYGCYGFALVVFLFGCVISYRLYNMMRLMPSIGDLGAPAPFGVEANPGTAGGYGANRQQQQQGGNYPSGFVPFSGPGHSLQ